MVTTTNNQMSGQNSDNNAGAAPSSGAANSREKKKKGLSLSSLKSPFKFLGKTYCKGCHKKCSGEGTQYFIIYILTIEQFLMYSTHGIFVQIPFFTIQKWQKIKFLNYLGKSIKLPKM